jgi:hypothetical protein
MNYLLKNRDQLIIFNIQGFSIRERLHYLCLHLKCACPAHNKHFFLNKQGKYLLKRALCFFNLFETGEWRAFLSFVETVKIKSTQEF